MARYEVYVTKVIVHTDGTGLIEIEFDNGKKEMYDSGEMAEALRLYDDVQAGRVVINE